MRLKINEAILLFALLVFVVSSAVIGVSILGYLLDQVDKSDVMFAVCSAWLVGGVIIASSVFAGKP